MSIPRVVFIAAAIQLLSSALAQSQTQVTVGGGATAFGRLQDAAPHWSAAVERVGSSGFGIGADGALLFDRTEAFPPYRDSERFRQFVGSLSATAHPRVTPPGRRARVEPLLGAGISLVTVPGCCGTVVMWNASAGAAVWLTRRVGVRLHARSLWGMEGEGGALMFDLGTVFRGTD